jgi:tRNA A37 threonylcarbamoyladenosine biosynthesis protein TsaE
MTLGLEDLLAEKAVVLIEWGERLGPAMRGVHPGARTVEIHIAPSADGGRRFEVREAAT